jgi:hypothetical protein
MLYGCLDWGLGSFVLLVISLMNANYCMIEEGLDEIFTSILYVRAWIKEWVKSIPKG